MCSQRFNDTVTETKPLEVVCIVNYRGNWAPIISWQLVDADNKTTAINSSKMSSSSKAIYTSLTSYLTVRATPEMNGSYFISRTHFIAANKPNRTKASNVPELNFTWASHAIDRCGNKLY